MSAPDKSSFLKRQLSQEDAIKQFYRPRIGAKVAQAMDIFDRLVSECETITKLGEKLQVSGQTFFLTPDDLKTNLDEFSELQQIALQGRALLTSLGYVQQRKNTPAVGIAPVGKTVEVHAIETQLPGSEPLQGMVVRPVRNDEPPPQPPPIKRTV